MSHNALNAVTGLTFATQKIVTLINSEIINIIFTYHPALLYFVFASSIIPDNIQLKLVSLNYIVLLNFILINFFTIRLNNGF